MTARTCNIFQLLSNLDTNAVTRSSQRYGETAWALLPTCDNAWMALGKNLGPYLRMNTVTAKTRGRVLCWQHV